MITSGPIPNKSRLLKAIKYIILYLLFLLPVIGLSQSRKREVPAYVGEELEYVIVYSFVNSGVASIRFDYDSLTHNYHIFAAARSIGLPNVIYKILDVYECYMDTLTGLPVKAIRNIREGNFRDYNEVTFDHSSRQDSTIIHSQKSGTKVVDKNILDILTGFYELRKNYIKPDLKTGDLIIIRTYFTDEIWDLKVRYMGKETIKIKGEKVRCLKFNPVTEVGRAFKTEEDMTVWFSDDKNNIPVKIRVDLWVGSFKAMLTGYKGLKYEFSALEKQF